MLLLRDIKGFQIKSTCLILTIQQSDNSRIDRCSHEWNQQLWIYKGKKRINREKNLDLAAEHRKWLSAGDRRHRHQSENDKQLFGSTTAMVHKLWILWRKGVRAHQSQAPVSKSFSNMRDLCTSCWNGKTWGHLSVPWWMWTFHAVENRWAVASCRIPKKPNLETEWSFTLAHERKKKRSFEINLNLWSHCAYKQRRD